MRIDNTNEIETLLNFPNEGGKGTFYRFALILRKKDYSPENPSPLVYKDGRREMCVRQWIVTNRGEALAAIPDMKSLADLTGGRIYLGLDRKRCLGALRAMRSSIDVALDQLADAGCPPNFGRLLNRMAMSAAAVAESSDHRGRRWLFDVDTTDKRVVREVEDVCVSVKGSQFKAPSESQMRFVRSQFWDSDVVVIEKPSAVDPKNLGGTAVLHMFHQKSEEDHENECA